MRRRNLQPAPSLPKGLRPYSPGTPPASDQLPKLGAATAAHRPGEAARSGHRPKHLKHTSHPDDIGLKHGTCSETPAAATAAVQAPMQIRETQPMSPQPRMLQAFLASVALLEILSFLTGAHSWMQAVSPLPVM